MNMRNIAKKAGALAGGAFVVGMTVTGAVAYQLETYPAKFIENGVFDGKIVVGERAAAQDIVGSIDIAASLQASSTVEEEVEGGEGEVQLEGDVFRIETSSDLLELREPVGAVYDTLTDSELEALTGGTITTDEGTTDYNQFVRFADAASTTLQKMAVNYDENEENDLGDYLVIDDNLAFFEWELEFTEGLESSTTGSQLEDLEDETFNIFGTPYTFVDSEINTATGAVTLQFMSGQVADTLREGDTKSYTIDGVTYEITLVFVSDPSSGTTGAEAQFSVNGEITEALQDGDTDTLSGGLKIGVRDLLVNSRDGVASFFLGAEDVEFSDSTTSAQSFDGTVEIGNENIEDGDVAILGSFTSSGNTTFEITNIKYRLMADASVGSTIYIPAGHGVREYLDEPEGLLSPTFDLRYEGLKSVETNPIMVQANSDHSYDMEVTNLRGKTYTWPLATNQNGVFKFGDDDDDFWFTEATPVGSATNLSNNGSGRSFFVSDDDYFLLSENVIGSATEKDDSAVMRYEDIDTSDRIITFTDMSTGESKEVSYQATTSFGDAIGVASNFVVEGNTYTVYVGPTGTSHALAIDLNGDGDVNGDEVGFTAHGGGVLDIAAAQTNFTDNVVGGASFTMTLTTPQAQFDGSSGADSFTWSIVNRTNNEIGLSAGSYSGPNEDNANSPWGDFNLVNDDNDDDFDRGMTDYGAIIELNDPSGSDKAEELTIHYPSVQRGAQVFVVAGSVESSSTGSGRTTTRVNPIAVGLAVLDRDAPAVGSENLIVVGGPCANTVAAELLGNPANCAEGFEPGKAIIRAWDKGQTVAILVAGYEADETTAAAKVLANYEDYELSGTEVEVVAADLNSISVQAPMMDDA